MNDDKAAGPDGIPIEVWKYGGNSLAELLVDLYQLCWQSGEVPQDFKDAKIVSIFKKKGSKHECGNHRGIFLLCVAGKILARVMLTRLEKAFRGSLYYYYYYY